MMLHFVAQPFLAVQLTQWATSSQEHQVLQQPAQAGMPVPQGRKKSQSTN
jgi:hypothetical protein